MTVREKAVFRGFHLQQPWYVIFVHGLRNYYFWYTRNDESMDFWIGQCFRQMKLARCSTWHPLLHLQRANLQPIWNLKLFSCLGILKNSPCAAVNAIVVSRTSHLNFKIFKVGCVNIVSIINISGSPEPVHIISRKHWIFNRRVENFIEFGISYWLPANGLLCSVST